MDARAGEVVAAAAEAAGTMAVALAGAKGCAANAAVLGPPATGALGVILMVGGGELRCTRGRKE